MNLTDLDDEDLMALLVKFTRYQDHLAGVHAVAEINERNADQLLELAKAKFLAGNWTGSSADRVAVSKANSATDPDVAAYTDAWTKLNAKRKLYGVFVESLARDAAVVSREITRRTSGREHGSGRADRYSP